MHILIIGGAGYIGGVTAHLAVRQGHSVTVFDNLSSGLINNLPDSATFIEGDVRNPEHVMRVFQDNSFDIILHFAAKILVPESMTQPYVYLHTNSFGVLNVVEQATNRGIRSYILSSTAAVYGTPKSFPITENSETTPINPYGESKLIAERILASYAEARGLNWLAFRYFNVAGAYAGVGPDYPFISHVIPALLNCTHKNRPFSINGNNYNTKDGTCVRDFVHVYDIARAHLMAAEKMLLGTSFNTAVNLGSEFGSSVKEIVTAFLAVTKKELEVVYGPRRDGDPDKLVASNRKARSLLGWEPEKTLEDILRDHTDWYDSLPLTARVKNINS